MISFVFFGGRRKEALTQRLIEAERAATADLVEKHAEEMLNLINEKREEIVKVGCSYEITIVGMSSC